MLGFLSLSNLTPGISWFHLELVWSSHIFTQKHLFGYFKHMSDTDQRRNFLELVFQKGFISLKTSKLWIINFYFLFLSKERVLYKRNHKQCKHVSNINKLRFFSQTFILFVRAEIWKNSISKAISLLPWRHISCQVKNIAELLIGQWDRSFYMCIQVRYVFQIKRKKKGRRALGSSISISKLFLSKPKKWLD